MVIHHLQAKIMTSHNRFVALVVSRTFDAKDLIDNQLGRSNKPVDFAVYYSERSSARKREKCYNGDNNTQSERR
jgi:hypothetical protein